jgi:IS1 family transposase
MICNRSFSTQTEDRTFRQKRPDLNVSIRRLLIEGVPQRGIARLLGCSKNTVDRKFVWLARNLPVANEKVVSEIISIDEMETIEHTKLKPLTIPLAVSDRYVILATSVGRISAKGTLAELSRKKYGFRADEREKALREMLTELKARLAKDPKVIRTDESPHYPKLIREFFPNSVHERHNAKESIKKKREMTFLNLNKKGYDPLFAVNQRSAKLRAHLKRLTRRSWCTTKSIDHLTMALNIFKLSQLV